MAKSAKLSKMTVDKLASITQGEFKAVREEMATKDDLKTTEIKILQAVDKIATKFDKTEKEKAAHTVLHKRITDDLHHHNQRIKKLEAKIL